jgi:hypothetical protein
MEESRQMTQSLTQTIAEQATDALHEAIRVAWQAGYDCALMDDYKKAVNVEAHYLSIVKEQGA